MNELERQAYLSAFGIESYMPRWRLPFAPESVPCVLPVLENAKPEQGDSLLIAPEARPSEAVSTVTVDLLANLKERPAPVAPVNADSILKTLEENKLPALQPFSLSIWRPVSGMLIVDSRNTTLALPTDLLLNNILRACLGNEKFNLSEEILRWPMIENRFVSRTAVDARNELQTWLAVENELRPINRLWLLGDDASSYFISQDINAMENHWKTVPVAGLSGNMDLTALLMPSLNEILKNPLDKARLWAAIK